MDESRGGGRSGPQAMMERTDAQDDGDGDMAREFPSGQDPETPFRGERDDAAARFEKAWTQFLAWTRQWWHELPATGGAILVALRDQAQDDATHIRALLTSARATSGTLLELARRGELLAGVKARGGQAVDSTRRRVQAIFGSARDRVAAAFASVSAALAAPLHRTSRPSHAQTVVTPQETRADNIRTEIRTQLHTGMHTEVPVDVPTEIPAEVWSELPLDIQSWRALAERVGLPRYRSRVAQKPLRWASAFLLVSMLISLLLPAVAVLGALADYNSIKDLGDAAVHHLTNAEQDLSGLTGKSKSGSTGSTGGSTGQGSSSLSLDPQAIARASGELQAAQQDFAELRSRLAHPDWVLSTAYAVPGLSDKMAELKALADVGYDASTVGVELSNAALPILTRIHDKGLSSTDPLITQDDWNNIEHAASDAQTLLTDISAKLSAVSINDLPISAKQKTQLAQVIVYLPTAQKALTQANQLLNAAGWLLGIGQPRHFLVQTLDRSELRPTGGFTGNYGVLTIDGGKLDPFTLFNVNDIEYGYKTNGWIFGRRPPSQYSWWPFANWGLRDSNLNADFPTTAQMILQVFKNEGQGQMDGLIQFSPVTIAHVLRVTGPIYVPVFNETVTADNLEAKLHYYEEDPRGIAIQQRLFPTDHTHSLRKRFTQAVTQLLQDKVKSLPPSQLLDVGKQLLADLQSKDLQVYFANPQLESLLGQLRATGAIDTTPGIDGYMLVQANTSVAKSTPYVNVTQQDNVTLDDQGGATHHLTITMQYQPTGPIYGLPTYRDYMRIYVPQQARLTYADGFDTGVPLGYAGGNPYPGGELSCPAGRYDPTQIKSVVFAGASGHLDAIGGPTETTSDVPGRTMWGGWVTIPQWCTAHLTLSWYVPGVVNSSAAPANAGPYTLLVQRQSGTFYTMNVTVHPSAKMAANGMQTTSYSAQIAGSMAFTLGKPNPVTDAEFFNATNLLNLLTPA